MRPKSKTFDALAESRKWRMRVSRKIAKMSPTEELAYFNRPRSGAGRSGEKVLPRVNQAA